MQTEQIEIKEFLEINNIDIQTEEITISTNEVATETISITVNDCEITTDLIGLNDVEIQTDELSEDRKFTTPDDLNKKKKNKISEVKQAAATTRISKADFPLQIKRVVFGKDSEDNQSKERKVKGSQTARPIVICKSEHLKSHSQQPSTSRQEYIKFENLEIQDQSKEVEEEELEEIRFSIHGDSSVNESDEEGEEINSQNVEVRKASAIRIPQFKISKTYDKRASSHNLRYI